VGAERLLLSCEHGGNEVPESFLSCFAGHQDLLRSHRGWDVGARELARHLAQHFGASHHLGTVTRLLVDLNRSPGSASLFSELTRDLPPEVRTEILARYYEPYRMAVTRALTDAVARAKPVIHLSVHTFTPQLDGVVRGVDVGILFDPRRGPERSFAEAWMRELAGLEPSLRIRSNEPYDGTDDGIDVDSRRRFDPSSCLALTLEVNQALVFGSRLRWRRLQANLARSLEPLIS
jgi:predicted N-formylglutamate amidohydrolase